MAADPHLMLPGWAARKGLPLFFELAHFSRHSNNLSIIKNLFDILNSGKKSPSLAKNGSIAQRVIFLFKACVK